VATTAIVVATPPARHQLDGQIGALIDHNLALDIRLAVPAADLANMALEVMTFVACPGSPRL